jgi:hypothetical protein
MVMNFTSPVRTVVPGGEQVSTGGHRNRMSYLVRIGVDGHPQASFCAFWWRGKGVGDHEESGYSCLLVIGTSPMNKPSGIKPGN